MLDKIKAYIGGGQAAKSKNALRYTMVYSEIVALAAESPFDAVVLAFKYGREKGYRMAKADDLRA